MNKETMRIENLTLLKKKEVEFYGKENKHISDQFLKVLETNEDEDDDYDLIVKFKTMIGVLKKNRDQVEEPVMIQNIVHMFSTFITEIEQSNNFSRVHKQH